MINSVENGGGVRKCLPRKAKYGVQSEHRIFPFPRSLWERVRERLFVPDSSVKASYYE